MNNLKISTRLALMTGFMSVILAVVGVLGINGLSKTNDALRTVYEDRTVSVGQMLVVNRQMLRNRISVLLGAEYPEMVKGELETLETSEKLIDKTWAEYKSTVLTPKEAEIAKDFEANRAAYNSGFLRPAVEALKSGDQKTLKQLVIEKDHRTLYPKVRENIVGLAELQLSVAKEEFEESQKRFAILRIVSIVAVVAGVLLAAISGFLLIRSIRRSLDTAINAANAVAAGDLSHSVNAEGKDEISVLMRALSAMRESLVKVVGNVREGSDGVATASAQIAQGNQDLSARTEKQASALEETSASMEQLGSTVRQNADNAQKANQLAVEASGVASRGGEVVSEVVTTMKEISDSSRRIADIINVIDGIAFQTNILALNAAVEAARAGEQGRGFAVVASEVRNLAQRSADAAKEIKSLITDSVSRVEKGTELADRAGATMAEVVTSVDRVTHLMGEISGASREQSAGVSQVGEAVTEMDQATQQNAALVEEMAAAASSLSGQAHDLVKAVSVFKLAASAHHETRREPVLRSATATVAKPVSAAKHAAPAKTGKPSAAPAKAAKPASKSGPAAEPAMAGGDDDWQSF